MKFLKYGTILMMLFLSACLEEVRPVLQSAPFQTVIEGSWTDNRGLNEVIISRSRNYYDSTGFKAIENAEVYIVHEDRQIRYDFQFVNSSLKYLPQTNVAGRQGQNYSLHVKLGNEHYVSKGTLLESPKIDSLSYSFKEGNLVRDEGYYITLHGKVPFEENNYYRIKVIRNDTLLNRRGDYLLFDDTFGSDALEDGFDIDNIVFRKGDVARISFYRLNKDAYDFLESLQGFLFNDGGLFSPLPENPPSNIQLLEGEKAALGYFMVGPVVTETITIE
ncbi:DUF4249 domain-containing protein [Echinicola marina]|uniref:DUF4249 domain-containing protein n=1 Tax=Echinicola marina TaxID=2859768 RepID=UPI001CF6CF7B|nr:DUF4249 domain-containing protein [Echinicola marina]UCS92796.1 DUF4249 domain-containing protein [Echinicola marina]